MSIFDGIRDLARNFGVNLEDGLGTEDLAGLGEGLGGLGEGLGGLAEDAGLGDGIGGLAEHIGLGDGISGLTERIGLDDGIGGVAEASGLTPDIPEEQAGQAREAITERAGDIDLAGIAERIGLPGNLIDGIFGR